MQSGHFTADGRPIIIQGQPPRMFAVRTEGGQPVRLQRIVSYAPEVSSHDTGNQRVRMERVPEASYDYDPYYQHYNTERGQVYRHQPQQSIVIGGAGGGGVRIGGGDGDGIIIHGGSGGGIQIARRGSGAFLISSNSVDQGMPQVHRRVISTAAPVAGYMVSQGQMYSVPAQESYVSSDGRTPRLYIRRGSDVGFSVQHRTQPTMVWSSATPSTPPAAYASDHPISRATYQQARSMVEPVQESSESMYPWRHSQQRSLDRQTPTRHSQQRSLDRQTSGDTSQAAKPHRPVRIVRIFSKDGAMHKEEEVVEHPESLDLFEELISHRLQKKMDAGKNDEPKSSMSASLEDISMRKPKKTILRQQLSDETPPGSPTYDSPKRNMFKNFRIVFDSCGDGPEGQPGGVAKEFHFKDFDDMVGKIQQIKEKVENTDRDVENTEREVENTERDVKNTGCDNENTARDKPCDCQYTCHHPCRKVVTLDCTSLQGEGKAGESQGSPFRKQTAESVLHHDPQVDDTDSGYYTNENSLKGMSKRPPGEYTLTRDDLRKRIEAFNNNNHGLIMSLQPDSNTFQGFIRVHMNLIRPINMSLTVRPPSIYDALGQEITEEGHEETAPLDDTQIASFYLPKDTSKVIHIRSDTSTQEVIKTLLSKYRITDNPRKFALYEKDLSRNGVMRKLTSDELPLPLCLSWEAEGLDERKFVLQENDTGDVIWEAFSLPELENFLRILKKEEEEYVEQIKAKYHLMKIHMSKRCSEILKLNLQGGKASPQKGKAASGAGAQSGKAPKGTGSPKSGSPHQSAKRGVTGREGAVNQSSASADSPTQQSRTSKTDKKDKEIFV